MSCSTDRASKTIRSARRATAPVSSPLTLQRPRATAGALIIGLSSLTAATASHRPTDPPAPTAPAQVHNTAPSPADLLATARSNDSKEGGLVALEAIAKVLVQDPGNADARQLRARITSHFVPAEFEIVVQDPDPGVVTDAAARARITATGLPWKIRHSKSGIAMLLCPPGEFTMGSTRDSDEKPPRKVCISRPFWIGETEVTRAQWCAVMGGDPRKDGQRERLPIAFRNWFSARQLCTQLGGGIRLPTEAEWEYACRGGTDTRFSFGDEPDPAQADRYAWHRGNSKDSIHEVATKLPNAWGLFDMHGNLGEWCADWYSVTYYREAPAADPPGPAQGEHRVTRGGSHLARIPSLSSANRDMFAPGDPDYTFNDVGIRVARSAQ